MRYRLFIFVMLMASFTSCNRLSAAKNPSFDIPYTVISPGSLQPTDAIPAPTDDILLTVTGDFSAVQAAETNAENLSEERSSERSIVMDRASIEAVGTVEYTVEDPFEKEESAFQGVLFRDLLSLWQVSQAAEHLTMTALNDYQVQVPISLLEDYPIMLALKQNGEVMTRDYRGPAMLVAPIDQYPAVQELAKREYWIWQIKTIHIE